MAAGSSLGHQTQTNSSRQISSSISPPTTINSSTTTEPATILSSYPNSNSSAAFQQVKQTQASLARLCRVQQQLQANNSSNNNNNIQQSNQSSQQQHTTSNSSGNNSTGSGQQQKPTTFVDCLIRRFKNCFDEDFCTVPMFVVGNLSPGSDGTHLILPPCVYLGRQNINRFSSPKNLRIMNSIRESCRSIEELDLGGNKLNDLIEVYKILQCTPNLRFLNLSENDLSRTAPVAMASINAQPTTTSLSTVIMPSTYSSSSLSSPSSTANQQWGTTTASNITNNQRPCLATLSGNTSTHTLGTRRHSSLGHQSASVSARVSTVSNPSVGRGNLLLQTRQSATRAAETRRLAAANALAQSKKTSSTMASKIADSAQTSSRHRQVSSSTTSEGPTCSKQHGKLTSKGQRNQTSPTSTMHLARSLSSLSAKDLRTSNSSLGRISSHRSSIRNSNSRTTTIRQSSETATSKTAQELAKTIASSSSHQKLFVQPIAESDDVDMSSETQQVTSVLNQPGSNPNNIQQQQQVHQHQPQIRQSTTTTNRTYNSSSLLSSGSASSNGSTSFRRTFESIRALALNNTGCQWRVVCSILSRMPNLEELHLSLNNYEKIDLEPSEFRHLSLKRLYLCNNPKLTNWEELDKLLIAFPSLEALSIANCNISQIPDNLDRAREWRKLCGLNINGWPIKEWPVIERLNQLPSLIDLKCRNLEILSTIDEPRHHLIARLPKLQKLNGSEIEEREDAEKAFIRFFMANSHLERPSRFHELMQIYGEISTVDVDVDLSPPSQAQVRVIYLNRNYYRKENNDDIMMSEDFLLKLMDNADSGKSGDVNNVVQEAGDRSTGREDVKSGQSTSVDVDHDDKEKPTRLFKDEGQEIVALNVDLRQTVRKFKTNLASLFGLDGQNLILYYIDHEMVGLMGAELLKHSQKKLWNYNVQDGDQFIVEER